MFQIVFINYLYYTFNWKKDISNFVFGKAVIKVIVYQIYIISKLRFSYFPKSDICDMSIPILKKT